MNERDMLDQLLHHDTCKTWKNGTAPAPETISQQPCFEDFIQNFLISPDYGTREEITESEIIKAVVSLIRNRSVADRSHYHGYDPKKEAESKYEKTTLMFKENQLFKNGMPLDCRLDDPQFTGMRINNNKDSISILLDFYHPEEGYSLKCVIFDIRQDGKRKKKQKTCNRTIATTDKKNETPVKPVQEKNLEKEEKQKKLF